MSTSQNGYPALSRGDARLRRIVVPAKNGTFALTIRGGSTGLILGHLALRYSETLQDVTQGDVLDDWGHAERLIRGNSTELSNHASGTAIDLNALLHPLGKVRTGIFASRTIQDQLHRDLRVVYKGAVRWGGDYHGRKDEMHFEIVQNIVYCEALAKRLAVAGRGARILKANPGLREEIYS